MTSLEQVRANPTKKRVLMYKYNHFGHAAWADCSFPQMTKIAQDFKNAGVAKDIHYNHVQIVQSYSSLLSQLL